MEKIKRIGKTSEEILQEIKESNIIHFAAHGSFASLITPENIAILVSLLSAAVGITTTAIKGIGIWLDERKSRKIMIRYKDMELEITGGLSESEIAKKLAIFGQFKEKLESKDVDIVVVGENSPNK